MARSNTDTSKFTKLGRYGVSFAKDGDVLLLAIPLDKAARKAAPLSSTGKNQLIAVTGPYIDVPGTDVKIMINATIPVDLTDKSLAAEAGNRQAAANLAKGR